MTTKLLRHSEPFHERTQNLAGSTLDRQITDLRNRMHAVSLQRLRDVTAHFGIVIPDDASRIELALAIGTYFADPKSPRHRGKMIAILNKKEED